MEDDRPKCVGCPRIFDWDEDWRMDDNGEIGCVACFTDGAECPFPAPEAGQ